MTKKTLTKLVALLGFILLPQMVGIGSGLLTASSIASWYSQIIKPSFTPPSFVFGPIWTVLYLLMGISSYLIWQKRNKHTISTSKVLYISQLILNFAWSILFFGFHNPFIAFVDIVLLWGLIVSMIYAFYKVDKKAAFLQFPYALWVSYASVLNLYIVILN